MTKIGQKWPQNDQKQPKIETKATKPDPGKPKLATFRGFNSPKTAKKPLSGAQKSPTKGGGLKIQGRNWNFREIMK